MLRNSLIAVPGALFGALMVLAAWGPAPVVGLGCQMLIYFDHGKYLTVCSSDQCAGSIACGEDYNSVLNEYRCKCGGQGGTWDSLGTECRAIVKRVPGSTEFVSARCPNHIPTSCGDDTQCDQDPDVPDNIPTDGTKWQICKCLAAPEPL